MDNKVKQAKYRLEFKQDAANSLGVSLSAIRRWVSAEKGATGAEQANPVLAEREELIRLSKERNNLLMEREILKKAAVFFAKEI